jgi:hypothetical protein
MHWSLLPWWRWDGEEPERRRKSVEVGGDEAQLLYLRYSVVGENVSAPTT